MGKTCDDILAWLIAAEAAVPAEEHLYWSYDYTITIRHLKDPNTKWEFDYDASHVINALWEAISAVDWARYHIAEALGRNKHVPGWHETIDYQLDEILAGLIRLIDSNAGTANDYLLERLEQPFFFGTEEQRQAIAERLLSAIREAK